MLLRVKWLVHLQSCIPPHTPGKWHLFHPTKSFLYLVLQDFIGEIMVQTGRESWEIFSRLEQNSEKRIFFTRLFPHFKSDHLLRLSCWVVLSAALSAHCGIVPPSQFFNSIFILSNIRIPACLFAYCVFCCLSPCLASATYQFSYPIITSFLSSLRARRYVERMKMGQTCSHLHLQMVRMVTALRGKLLLT